MKNIETEYLDDIVLYHGSLTELNSRDPTKQYTFAKGESLILDFSTKTSPDNVENLAKAVIKGRGCDGLVNKRISCFSAKEDRCIIEGTPIVKVGKT